MRRPRRSHYSSQYRLCQQPSRHESKSAHEQHCLDCVSEQLSGAVVCLSEAYLKEGEPRLLAVEVSTSQDSLSASGHLIAKAAGISRDPNYE